MRKRLSLTLLCLFFTLQAFATDWVLPAQTIDAAHYATISGSIAIDQDGNSYAVWVGDITAPMPTTTSKVYYSKRPFEGTWSTPILLSGDHVLIDLANLQNFPQIGATRGGGVVVAWATGTAMSQDVQVRSFDGQTWSPITTLTQTPSSTNVDPKLSVLDANLLGSLPPTAVVVWVQSDGTNYEILTNDLGDFKEPDWESMPNIIDGLTTDVLDQIQLAKDLGGIFTAIWRDFDGLNYSIRTSSRIALDNTWSNPQSIVSTSNILTNPEIALNNGTALAIWVEQDSMFVNPDIVSTAFGNPLSETWNAPTNMITTEVKAAFPQVGIDSAGYAVAMWQNSTDAADMDNFGVAASTYSPTMGWAAPTTLEMNINNQKTLPQFGLDGTGNAIAVWLQTATLMAPGTLVSSTLPFNGSWSPLTILNTPTPLASGAFAQIAVNTNGLAAALWFNLSLTSSSVQSAVTEMPDSPCATCPNPISPSTPVTMWFVNNANPVAGNGSYNNPYKNLHTALDASHPCDVIYVFPGNAPYDAIAYPFILLNNQRLLGTTLEAFQRCPEAQACNLPLLTFQSNNLSGSSPVVAISDNNQISGFHIQTIKNREPSFGIVCINSQNFLLTDTIFTVYAGPASDLSSAAILAQFKDLSKPTGEYTITNCIFQAANNPAFLPGDLVQCFGIIMGESNNGLFKIDNNLFTYLDAQSGFYSNIILPGTAGSKVLIRNNRMFNQFAPQNVADMMTGDPFTSGITVVGQTTGFSPLPPLSLTIENNEIRINKSPLVHQAPGVGIQIRAGGDYTLCAKLRQNSVIWYPESNITLRAGYLFDNNSSIPFVLDFDSSNRGNLGVNFTIDNNFEPIFLTSDCP